MYEKSKLVCVRRVSAKEAECGFGGQTYFRAVVALAASVGAKKRAAFHTYRYGMAGKKTRFHFITATNEHCISCFLTSL